MTEPQDEKTTTESFAVKGEEMLAKVKELVHEGNIRRIIIKNEEGKQLLEIPMTIGVVAMPSGIGMSTAQARPRSAMF